MQLSICVSRCANHFTQNQVFLYRGISLNAHVILFFPLERTYTYTVDKILEEDSVFQMHLVWD